MPMTNAPRPPGDPQESPAERSEADEPSGAGEDELLEGGDDERPETGGDEPPESHDDEGSGTSEDETAGRTGGDEEPSRDACDLEAVGDDSTLTEPREIGTVHPVEEATDADVRRAVETVEF